eukprot:g43452.t1
MYSLLSMPPKHKKLTASLEIMMATLKIQIQKNSPFCSEGLRALYFFLEQRPEPSPSTTILVSLAELVLTLNNFSFNSFNFLQ